MRYTAREGWSAPFPPFDSPATLVLAFGAPRYADETRPIDDLRAAYPAAALLGCSTAGEILGGAIYDDSLVAAVVRFDATEIACASAPLGKPEDSRAAGSALARALRRPSLRAVLVFSEGVAVNGSDLLRGLSDELGDVPVSGGLAGDGDRFARTWVVASGGLAHCQVGAAGLYGERLQLSHASRGGWDIFGPERRITRSAGNVLYELDGRPALDLYKQYLGDRANGLPAAALLFPLSVRPSKSHEPIVRTVVGVDEHGGTLTFAGDVPQGSLAQLMRANFDRLIEGAGSAARLTATIGTADRESLAIAVSCVGRRLVLGVRAEEEVEAAANGVGGAKLIGFYSYGEISPLPSGKSELHNQTMTLTRIWES